MKTHELINEYIAGAELHGVGTQASDHEKANKGYAQLNGAYNILKEEDPKLAILRPLLKHDNLSVRLWAASHLLPLDSVIALPVLNEIARFKKGPFAFSAMMTIKQWQKGQLHFNDPKDSKK